tara:strand:- start:262 stop:738 length:477 start_codon:yes stop_codon:yes gene_type:complete
MKRINFKTSIATAFFISFTIAFLTTSCGSTVPTTGEISKSIEKSGTITIVAKGYGKNESIATNHSKEQAFVNLLFRGIPNTSYSNGGMIGNETEARNRKPGYFKDFFEKNGLDKFVIKTRKIELFSKKDKSVKCEITINTKSLRNNLTQNGVIAEFGF